jgi:cell division protein FtsB
VKDPSPHPPGVVARPKRAIKPDAGQPRSRWAAAARVALWASAAVVVVVVLFVFVFPTRTYLTQRHQLSLAAQRIRVLDAQNRQLAAEADKLQSSQEIKRIARAQYHMVEPGAQAYVVLPAPAPPTTTPPAPPPPARHTGGWWRKLTSWLP